MSKVANQTQIKRITRDLQECRDNDIHIEQNADNIAKITCVLIGPPDSPYSQGIYKLDVTFPPTYPFAAPIMTFKTKMYHPNISESGNICLDILKDKWSAALSFHKILLSIQSLLTDPNPDSPLNGEAARLYKTDRKAYDKTVEEYAAKYANGL
jgi:ubiquitin-conjugating enzyme E2 D/E